MKKLFLVIFVLALISSTGYANNENSRYFEFDYEVVVKDIPEDASELKVWIPHLSDREHQIVEEVTVNSPYKYTLAEEGAYNNKMLSFDLKAPYEEEYRINVHYKVKRLEYSKSTDDTRDFSRFLRSSKLVTLSPRIRELAQEVTEGKETTVEKARAIYDYVYENVSYDKTIPGWGKGDTERVCDLRTGNCTDFHSLFISLSRASDIPARFFIGVPFSGDQQEGETTKYHCWAEFYDENSGWIPVDISEAWKDKSKVDYYFGTIGENRLEFSMGRDINLEPRQTGEPLNYFIYPYAEVDGEIFKKIGVLFKYKSIETDES